MANQVNDGNDKDEVKVVAENKIPASVEEKAIASFPKGGQDILRGINEAGAEPSNDEDGGLSEDEQNNINKLWDLIAAHYGLEGEAADTAMISEIINDMYSQTGMTTSELADSFESDSVANILAQYDTEDATDLDVAVVDATDGVDGGEEQSIIDAFMALPEETRNRVLGASTQDESFEKNTNSPLDSNVNSGSALAKLISSLKY